MDDGDEHIPSADAPALGSERRSVGRIIAGQWRVWFGLAVSAVFLWWAFRQAQDVSLVVSALRNANYTVIVPAIAIFFVDVWFRALRWRILLHPIQKVPMGPLYRAMVIGFTVNDVLPARLGEIARAILVSRQAGVSKSAVLATIVVERVFDGVTMFIFLALAGLTTGLRGDVDVILRIAGVLFLGGAAGLIGVALAPTFALSILSRLLLPIPEGMRARVLAVASRFISGLAVLQSGRLVGLILLTSLAAWGLEGLMYVVIASGFPISVELPAFFLMLAIVNLGTMIPSSPGYVGTFQGLSVFALGLFGVDQNVALGYSFVLHATLLLPVTLLGFYFLGRYNMTLKSLMKERET